MLSAAFKNLAITAYRTLKMKLVARDGLPRGTELTSLSKDFRNDPNSILGEVRDACPVHRDGILRDFLVTDGASAKEILTDKTLVCDPRQSHPHSTRRMRGEDLNVEPPILFSDGARHRRLRSLLGPTLAREKMANSRPRVRELIESLVHSVDEEEFDFIEKIAKPLPTIVVADFLGVDREKHEDFKQWSDDTVAYFLNPLASSEVRARGEKASEKIIAYVATAVEKRLGMSKKPQDLISDLIDAEDNGEKLSVEEICSTVQTLLVAGNQTTTDLVGTMMANILEAGDSYQQICSDSSLIENAVEEALRFDAPISSTDRIAAEDMEYKGARIPKGYGIAVMMSAANHDPAMNSEPEKFDIHRTQVKHWSFGGGRHFCIGAPLARIEAQELLLAISQHMPNLRSMNRPRDYSHSPGFRGLDSFWVTSRPS